jgi:transcriptional regulator with XRE-family HTH domain
MLTTNQANNNLLIDLLEKITIAKRFKHNKELAQKIGFSTTTLFTITNGETKNLSAKNRQRLADFLKIPAFEIEEYLKGSFPIEAVLRNLEGPLWTASPTAEQNSLQAVQKFYTAVLPYLLPKDLYEISLSAIEELQKKKRNYRVVFMKREDIVE